MTVATLIDAMALMQEIIAVEGIPAKRAAELTEELQADLAAYAREWDDWAEDARRCPLCGALARPTHLSPCTCPGRGPVSH